MVNKKETAMIEIDGSRKSGSGTIVRDSIPYSVLTGEELRLYNIRAGRTKPGLRPQHLKGIEASAQLCRGMITGAAIDTRYDTAQSPAYRDASIQPGASLALWAETDTACPIGADMAGARGRPAELIGKEVARCLIETLETTATVDEHVADQLIPFAALADGWSSYVIPTMTDHLETRLLLIEEFFGARTEINDRVVRIRGIGYRR